MINNILDLMALWLAFISCVSLTIGAFFIVYTIIKEMKGE